ncbi:hypothetical protein DFH06DRAFT_1017621, partial [Mycena polygramma]
IVPTEELIWIDCYSGNQCARLKVFPLDYSHPENAAAAIAVIRVHSGVPHDSPAYRGPVLINPGGPGGSGVDMVLTMGSQFSTILGTEFDIVGFDPRGIRRSTPRASFFETRVERKIWSQFRPSKISMNASTDALPSAWARSVVQGQLVAARHDSSLRFINTDHTARDMLRIVQAHSRDKLQYWGFSCVIFPLAGTRAPHGRRVHDVDIIWTFVCQTQTCSDTRHQPSAGSSCPRSQVAVENMIKFPMTSQL